MIIDPHAHIAPERFIDDVRHKRFGDAVTIEKDDHWELLVTRSRILGQERIHRNPLPIETYDVESRVTGMKKQGVDLQILSVVPPMTFYALDARLNIELSASLNDALLSLAREFPERFRCIAQIPLQHPEAAAAELERAVGLGHLGAQIGSHVAGRNLDDPDLDVVWRKAVELDVPLSIHPIDVMGINDRLKDYYLRNLIGMPLETTICAACLIFGGVLDRFPEIKFILLHSGGFIPWVRGRWQHGYSVRDEPKVNGVMAPERYLKRFSYDTIIHNADAFEFAVRTLGSTQIFYGSDFPFDMGYLGPAEKIPGLSSLSENDRMRVLSDNTRTLFKLES